MRLFLIWRCRRRRRLKAHRFFLREGRGHDEEDEQDENNIQHGTVTGMVAVFDVMAITNGADAKAMSAGVSRATIPTMAGMVASLSGILFTSGMDRRVNRSVQQVEDAMEIS